MLRKLITSSRSSNSRYFVIFEQIADSIPFKAEESFQVVCVDIHKEIIPLFYAFQSVSYRSFVYI